MVFISQKNTFHISSNQELGKLLSSFLQAKNAVTQLTCGCFEKFREMEFYGARNIFFKAMHMMGPPRLKENVHYENTVQRK